MLKNFSIFKKNFIYNEIKKNESIETLKLFSMLIVIILDVFFFWFLYVGLLGLVVLAYEFHVLFQQCFQQEFFEFIFAERMDFKM